MISETFTITPRAYLNRLTVDWLARHWLLLSLPFLVVLVWTMFDLRALYVALILIFLLYPMGLTLVWFNYALSPQSIKAVYTKRVAIADNKLTISYLPKNEDDTHLPSNEIICWDAISGYEMSSKQLIVRTGGRLDDCIIIPLEAMNEEFRATLTSKLEKLFPLDNL